MGPRHRRMNIIRRLAGWRRVPLAAWAPLAIVVTGIIAHALLLFTDYVIWDGWWCVADILDPADLPIMRQIFKDVGRPLDLWFYVPFKALGGEPVIWSKVLGASSWILACTCMYIVLRKGAGLPKQLATAVSLLAVTMPSFDLLGEISLWMYTACVLLFWLAWAILCASRGMRGWAFFVLRCAAISLFFISFNLNSQLVFFYGIAAMLFAFRLPDMNWKLLPSRVQRAAVRHADYLLLPIIFWTWKTLFTPALGSYAQDYNRPSFGLFKLLSGYGGMALHFLAAGAMELLSSANCMASATFVSVAAAFALSRCPMFVEPVPRSAGLGLAVWAFVLLGAAAFPYLAVGQPLASEGWLNRNAILCNFPLALMFVGIFTTLNQRMLPVRPWLWMAAVFAMVVLGIGNCQRNYLALQAFGAKERSIQRKLATAINEHHASFVQLRDYFYLPATIPYYPPSIWTFIASGTASKPKAFVMDTRALAPDQIVVNDRGQQEVRMPTFVPSASDIERAIEETTIAYAFEEIPRLGTQILVAIRAGDAGDHSVTIGLRYLALRISDFTRCREFEDSMTVSEVISLPPIEK